MNCIRKAKLQSTSIARIIISFNRFLIKTMCIWRKTHIFDKSAIIELNQRRTDTPKTNSTAILAIARVIKKQVIKWLPLLVGFIFLRVLFLNVNDDDVQSILMQLLFGPWKLSKVQPIIDIQPEFWITWFILRAPFSSFAIVLINCTSSI